MKKFAVIDVGSNSVRLMFVADGKVLYKRIQTTRLGEGIANNGFLKPEAIERTAIAVSEFYNTALKEGAEEVCAFATAAVRAAKNGKKFVNRVKALCGLFVEVISGATEAEIGILGALGNKDGAVLDIGGASTEIVVKKAGELIYQKSVDIGVVRLKDKCGREKERLLEEMKRSVKEFGDIPTGVSLCAIGGTATTLAAQALRLEMYESDKITGAKISLADLKRLTDKLFSMTVEEISALPCMPKGRADVIVGGALWLSVILETYGFEEFTVSDRDNLEGYAIKTGRMETL